MTLTYRDRVVDVSTTTGTGTFTLAGQPPPGFRDFTAFPTGSTVRYSIVHANNLQWEVGQGVWTTSGATISRAKVFASSNAGALVDFSAGSKTVSAGPVAADETKPVFRAYASASQSVVSNTWTKVNVNTVQFDTLGAFNTSTNRYQPTVAGYYRISGQVNFAGFAGNLAAAIYKNATSYAIGANGASWSRSIVTDLVYLNGSTDYVELWGFCASSLLSTAGTGEDLYFSGELIAPAA